MAKDHLVVHDEGPGWRISWFIAEDGDIGGCLGQDEDDGLGDPPSNRDVWEHWIASKVAREAKTAPVRDYAGFYWETEREAKAVLRQIKEVMKQDRPLPEWAKTALAEGWKPPKGWKA